jgi:hypothetical protein
MLTSIVPQQKAHLGISSGLTNSDTFCACFGPFGLCSRHVFDRFLAHACLRNLEARRIWSVHAVLLLFPLFHQIWKCCDQITRIVYIEINIKVHNKNNPMNKKQHSSQVTNKMR